MKKFLSIVGLGLSIIWTAGAQTPSATINGVQGPFIFNGGGVSQSGQTFTFTGGSGTVAIGNGGTGATTAAGANLNITGVTQTGTLGTSSQVSTFPGTVAAGTATPTTIGSNGVLLNGVPALQAQTSLNNYYSGGAGNLTGTGNYNTANGYARSTPTPPASTTPRMGFRRSKTTTPATTTPRMGFRRSKTTPPATTTPRMGSCALRQHHRQLQHREWDVCALLQHHRLQHREWVRGALRQHHRQHNTANGYEALYDNTTGSNNTANGFDAGQYIADGVTANQTSSNSVYEGFQAYPLAYGDTNENVIGNTAIGNGSNTTTLGNSATVGTWLNGTQHITATAPTASAGSRSGVFHQCRWRDHRSECSYDRNHHLCQLGLDECSVLRSHQLASSRCDLQQQPEQDSRYLHVFGPHWKPLLSLRWKLRRLSWQTKL